MALIDFILNLVALGLWLNWLSVRFDPLVKTSAASLVGTLRKADRSNPNRWIYLASFGLLILVRALAYWEICGPAHVTPALDLGIVYLSIRSDHLFHMLLFSILSFALTLAGFYFWMLLLSVVNFKLPNTDPFQKMVRLYLGWWEALPRIFKLMIPFVVGAAAWFALHPILAWLKIVPSTRSMVQLLEQAGLIGAAAWLAWKYLIVGILALHLLNSYVYLGNHSFWIFVNSTATNLLSPFRWVPMRFGKMDFLPVVVIALVFLLTEGFLRLCLYLQYRHLLPF